MKKITLFALLLTCAVFNAQNIVFESENFKNVLLISSPDNEIAKNPATARILSCG